MRGRSGEFWTIALLLGTGLVSFYFGYFHGGTVCDPTCRDQAAFTVEPLPLIVGAAFFLFGLSLLVRALRKPKFIGPALSRPTRELSLEEQLSCVRREDQEWLAREARAYYLKHLFKPARPTGLDQQMLSLFDSIEAGAPDVDAKIEGLRDYRRREGFFRGYGDYLKLDREWNAIAYKLQRADSGATRSDSMWQLRINWNRMLRAMGSTWGAPNTISPTWVGPAPRQAPKLEEIGIPPS